MNVPGKKTRPRTEIVFIAALSVAVFALICTAERESYWATRLNACFYQLPFLNRRHLHRRQKMGGEDNGPDLSHSSTALPQLQNEALDILIS